MRQVPAVNYLVIGSGRMAMHFCHYLTLLNIPYHQWSRKTHSHNQLNVFLQSASHILLLISDSQIATFANNLNINKNQILLHFSGQLSLDNIIGIHPLGTFSSQLYEKENYLSIPFIVEENSPPISTLLPLLPNQSYAISKELKAYYHALCVLSSNFSCILWQKFFHELQHTLNLSPTVGQSFLKQTFLNLSHNPNGALTGPLVRGDQETIKANLTALKDDKFLNVYQSFVDLFKQASKT